MGKIMCLPGHHHIVKYCHSTSFLQYMPQIEFVLSTAESTARVWNRVKDWDMCANIVSLAKHMPKYYRILQRRGQGLTALPRPVTFGALHVH